MQACSVLHVAHVGVRRVTVVIVHIGHEEVVVVVHFCVAIFVRDLLYQEMFSLHLPSVTVDCVDCYRCNHDKLCIKFLRSVVFTHTVGYSRPPLAVNDPSATNMGFGKS